ncbi:MULTISPECIES: hypothetical protein [unclassified Leptolyngbya]|uniref:hypothetical protein n=1 Tax=unclassified Leptolyngbya TaxID=2650499 RepID=UPI001683812D|nr:MULTISPECIES: hypothetical protein [unclassified Leptolyngbya]MBD1912317.1 hypothetical protein [Leptolyngbya sp. FACHB-8]MBD2158047.1 hypothetical protein [Leptolyngbya sp. FACHB-16]
MAVHILMAYHLKLPEDLYYWGQNRLGSAVPILSNLLLKITSLSPVEAISYVQYGLLLAGFICLSTLFKTYFSRLIFALAWFLPIPHFHELVFPAHPYGPQFAFTGIALFIINYLLEQKHLKQWRRQVLISSATLCLFTSLWISDLHFVFMAILAAITVQHVDKTVNQGTDISWRDRLRNLLIPDVINIIITSIVGFSFILFAKHEASGTSPYGGFSSFSQILEVLNRLITSAIQTLTFQVDSPILSIYAVLFVLLVGYAIYWWSTERSFLLESRFPHWAMLFFLNAIFSFGLILVSNWLYINDVSLRYFSVVYISAWMAFLLLVEQVSGAYGRRMKLGLFLMAIASIFLQATPVLALKVAPPYVLRLQPFENLAPAGFIGEYWSSYVLCSADPANLNCTPYDQKGRTPCPDKAPEKVPVRTRRVRCSRCVRRVLKSPNLYLVKNDWLEDFPREIEQFGVCLIRSGKPRKIQRYEIARYQVQTR